MKILFFVKKGVDMGNFKSIGSDMEVFAQNSKGEHVALCGLIGGSKGFPKQIKDLPPGFMVQEDNVSLEFNIPPVSKRGDFIQYMEIMRKRSELIINDLGFKLSKNSSASFGKDQLIHPNALEFGCEPDYDAWKLCENPKPKADDISLRTAGGHIHIGTDRDMIEVIKNMDLFVGVPSIIIDSDPSSITRRKLYGKAGAMRPKMYGVEYRTPSNFWVFDNALIGWIYDQTSLATNFTEDISEDEQNITNCINNGDINLAHSLVKKYGININYKKETVTQKKQDSLYGRVLVGNEDLVNIPLPAPTFRLDHEAAPQWIEEATTAVTFNTRR